MAIGLQRGHLAVVSRRWGTGLAALMAAMAFAGPTASFQDVPLRCGDLLAVNQSVTKRTDRVAELGEELDLKHWKKLSPQYTDEALLATFRAATSEAEARVASITGLDHADMRRLVFDRSRSFLVEHLKLEPLAVEGVRDQIVTRVSTVVLLTTGEYVDVMVAKGRAEGSTASTVTLQAQAYRQFMASCGRNGLSPNAFYDEVAGVGDGNVGMRFVVVCPGLVLDAHDYGISRQDLLDALSFTFGHELGHAIDASVYPELYGRMAECYRRITEFPAIWNPGLADEISADHWGAVVLAETLRTRPAGAPPPEHVARVIAYATRSMERETQDGSEARVHAPVPFRVNQTIARLPAMVTLLGCPQNGPHNPGCALQGIVPADS